jgi:hypothetical protein
MLKITDITARTNTSFTILSSLLGKSDVKIDMRVIGAFSSGFALIYPFSTIVGLAPISLFSLNPFMLDIMTKPVMKKGSIDITVNISKFDRADREATAEPRNKEPTFPPKTLAG